MLPDADLALRHVLPITHHGVTHTVVFVTAMSVFWGAVAARYLTDSFNANRWIRSTEITDETVFAFATGGLLVGGISHLFADVLSAPDIAPPLSPFWPLYTEPVIVDVVYYASPVWNLGLITAGVLVHLALYRYERYPLETRVRIGDREEHEPATKSG